MKPSLFLNVLIEMKDNNASEYTIHFTSKAPSFLSKHANLEKPDEVKHFTANLQSRNGYKRNLCIAYNKFCKHIGIQWQMPFHDPEAQNIKLPTREKLNMLIANASRPLALKLSISMETGLRPIELCRLKVKDIDTEHKVINPITAKHGAPRTPRISENLNQRIQEHIIQNKLQPNDRLFKGNSDYYGTTLPSHEKQFGQKTKRLSNTRNPLIRF